MTRTNPYTLTLLCTLLTGCGLTILPGPVGDDSSATNAENRSVDGRGNNRQIPEWGQGFTMEMRKAPAAYTDGVSAPSGADRPNPRLISNIVGDQSGQSILNGAGLSDWVWQWGQFLDHDISLTQGMSPQEAFPIAVPLGDVMFDPASDGDQVIMMGRSEYDPQSGSSAVNPRQQLNEITAFIDASNVYGSDADRAAWLRTGVGGKLKTSEGDLLPFSDGSTVNAGPGGAPSFGTELFTAGDIRANEQAALVAAHTLFVREHNRLAAQLAAENPDWTDEQIYQRARKIVGAQMQVITYHEFLPAILGPMAPNPREAQYDPGVNPTIANEFAAAGYRIGHTMLSPRIMRMNPDGTESAEGPLSLRDAFFNPQRILLEGGVEPLLLGLASQSMQQIDNMVVDDVRNFLFGEPGEGGFDLASLNIQRGRDHGLPDYNTLREAYGLARKRTFAEISSDPQAQDRLERAYDRVDLIDPWIGGLSEDHLAETQVGELVATVLADQFTRLRDGDRFFYRHDPGFTPAQIDELENTRLSDIIRRNTTILVIQEDVFHVAR